MEITIVYIVSLKSFCRPFCELFRFVLKNLLHVGTAQNHSCETPAPRTLAT